MHKRKDCPHLGVSNGNDGVLQKGQCFWGLWKKAF